MKVEGLYKSNQYADTNSNEKEMSTSKQKNEWNTGLSWIC